MTAAFDSYPRCGLPEKGGLSRLGCAQRGTERALPLSCKRRGICPSCRVRRLHDLANPLVERVLPDVPIRQYALSSPSELVGRLGARTELLSALARIFVRCMFDAIRRSVLVRYDAHDVEEVGAAIGARSTRLEVFMGTRPTDDVLSFVIVSATDAVGHQNPAFTELRASTAPLSPR